MTFLNLQGFEIQESVITPLFSIPTLPLFRQLSHPFVASAALNWRPQYFPSAQSSNPSSHWPLPGPPTVPLCLSWSTGMRSIHSIPQVKASVCYLFSKLFLETPVSCWPFWPHKPMSANEPSDNLLASFPSSILTGTDTLSKALWKWLLARQ